MNRAPAAAAILLLLCASAPAAAQTVDVLNALVVYFDEAATSRAWYGTGAVTAYLVAGPMVAWNGGSLVPCQQLEAWNAQLILESADPALVASVTPRGPATPAAIPLTNNFAQLAVVLQPGLPLNGRTVVAELSLVVPGPASIAVCLWAMDYVADGRPGGFSLLTRGPDGPMDMTCHVAAINAPAPVPAAPASWSAVKALYR